MIWALYTKELRYRVTVLLAIPLLLAAAAFWVWSSSRAPGLAGILHVSFQGLSVLILASLGFLCGFWQLAGEARIGPWAFLRHRPATASQLFFAKLGAAVTLYSAACVPAIGGLLAYLARARNYPVPWLWGMAIPITMDTAAGVAYLLAGLLVASRDARWFGSRLFPVGLAIWCSVTVCMAVHWWAAAIAITTACAILFIAAWSSFVSRGNETHQAWIGRLLVAASLLPACIVIPLAPALVTAFEIRTETYLPSSVQLEPQSYYPFGTELYFLDASPNPITFKGATARLLVDSVGHLQSSGPTTQATTVFYDETPVLRAMRLRLDYQQENAEPEPAYRTAGRFTVQSYGDPAGYGFFVPDWGCFAVYGRNDDSVYLRGYLGSTGLVPTRDRVVRFQPAKRPVIYGQANLVIEPHRIIELQGDAPAVLFSIPPDETAIYADYTVTGSRTGRDRRVVGWTVVTDRHLYLVDKSGNLLFRFPHQSPDATEVMLTGDIKLSRFGVLYTHRKAGPNHGPDLFVAASAGGKEIGRAQLPPLPKPPERKDSLGDKIVDAVTPLGLLASDAAYTRITNAAADPRLNRCVVAAIVSMLCAALGTVILRRSIARRSAYLIWLPVVILGGIAALLLMLSMRQIAACVPCPGCGRRRPVTSANCPHCRAAFAPPDPGPLAIFDANPVSAESAAGL